MTAKDPGAGKPPAEAHAARLNDPLWHVKTKTAKKNGAARRYLVWLAQSGGSA